MNYHSSIVKTVWVFLDFRNTQSFTTTLLNKEVIDVASIWYTAWVNAGLTSVNDWKDYSQSVNEPTAYLPQRRDDKVSLNNHPLD